MADNLQSGMAQPALAGGMQVVLEALDPTTGANVAGVVVSRVVISGDDLGGDGDGLELVPVLPLLTYGPGGLS